MHNEVFADSIGEITVTGQTVRIDLVSLSPGDRDAAGQPLPVFRQRIVMPIEGFANSLDLMQRVLNGLIDAGAIKRVAAEAPAARAKDGVPIITTRSPNFG